MCLLAVHVPDVVVFKFFVVRGEVRTAGWA